MLLKVTRTTFFSGGSAVFAGPNPVEVPEALARQMLEMGHALRLDAPADLCDPEGDEPVKPPRSVRRRTRVVKPNQTLAR